MARRRQTSNPDDHGGAEHRSEPEALAALIPLVRLLARAAAAEAVAGAAARAGRTASGPSCTEDSDNGID